MYEYLSGGLPGNKKLEMAILADCCHDRNSLFGSIYHLSDFLIICGRNLLFSDCLFWFWQPGVSVLFSKNLKNQNPELAAISVVGKFLL